MDNRENRININWYPGHMTKAKRQMQEDIRLIDLIIELVDARVPLSSRNPDIDQLGMNKARLILLNKADLADDRQNERWKEYFQEKGFHVVKVDSRNWGRDQGYSGCDPGSLQGKDRKGQKARDQEPPDPCHGSRHPKCGQIHLY